MIDKGGARAGGMPLYKYVGNRILTGVPERADRPASSPSGTAATAPTASTRSRDLDLASYSDGFDFDTEIILGLHARREAHRRGPDPDLLRRRDLLRQRHELRQGRHRRRACATGPAQHGLRRRRRVAPRPTPTSSSRRARLPRRAARVARRREPPPRCSTSAAPTASFAEPRARLGHHVTASTWSKHDGVAERVDALRRGRPQPAACPPRSGASTTSSSPATSSSTSIDPQQLLDRPRRDGSRPAARSSCRVPNFGHWYPRGRVAVGRSTTTSAACSTAATCGSSPARTHRAAGRRVRPAGRSSTGPSARRSTSLDAAPRRPRPSAAGRAASPRRPGADAGVADDVRLPVPLPPGAWRDRSATVGAGVDQHVRRTHRRWHRPTSSPCFNVSTRPRPHGRRPGFFSNFFELQARAFLDGHHRRARRQPGHRGLRARRPAPTCTSRRSPRCCGCRCCMTTHEFDGRLTLLSMALAWIVLRRDAPPS